MGRLLVLALMAVICSCAAIRSARIGAPEQPYLGPANSACAESEKYKGTPAGERGLALAESNIAANRLVFTRYGTRIVIYPRPLYDVRYEQILAAHGITFQEGDHEFPPWGEYYSYMCRLDQHIRQHFGDDFWVRTDAQARSSDGHGL
jgi:hypothetical protein